MTGLHLLDWIAQVSAQSDILSSSHGTQFFTTPSPSPIEATELSVVEAAFKISQAGASGVVDELRDALVDTYA